MQSTILFSLGLIACFVLQGSGQTTPSDPQNEEYDLNIIEKRITETDLERGNVLVLASRDLRLQVGASVRAASIDVILRGVTGHVTFRVSVDDLRRRLQRLNTVILNSR